MRFGNPALLVDLVVGAEGGVKDVVVAIAVNLVGAALRHGVHQSASGLAELSLESRARDLEFADYVFAELEGNARASDLLRKKGVVIVAAVDGVVVEISRNTVEADHAITAVGRGAGGEKSKVG